MVWEQDYKLCRIMDTGMFLDSVVICFMVVVCLFACLGGCLGGRGVTPEERQIE